MSPDSSSNPPATTPGFPRLRSVGPSAPFVWILRGATDMRACLPASFFFGLCFAGMGLAITLVFEHAYAYASALTSGFLLLGPFLAIGLYELSRRREAGLPLDFAAAATIWRRNAGNVGLFALVLMIVFLIWARASLVIFALFYTEEMPDLRDFLGQVVRLENLEFLIVYTLAGLGFALFVLAISLVSIPLMLDRRQDAITAMIASVGALLRNPLPCLLWAALIAGLTLLGFMSFHAGLVIVTPVLGHATWHAYRDLVEPADDRPSRG